MAAAETEALAACKLLSSLYFVIKKMYTRNVSFGVIVALAILIQSCICNGPSYDWISDVTWNTDGENIYYIEIVDPGEFGRMIYSGDDCLYYDSPDLKSKEEVDCVHRLHPSSLGLSNKSLFPSPVSSSTILYAYMDEDGNEYVIVKGKNRRFEEILKEKFDFPAVVMQLGWHPSGEKIYFTDQNGIRIRSLDGEINETLIPGKSYGMDWSPDGRYLVYKVENGRKGEALHIFDTVDLQDQIISSASSDGIHLASISPDATKIAYSVDFVDLLEDGFSTIRVVDIAEGVEREIWRGSPWVTDLQWTANGNLLFANDVDLDPSLNVVTLDGEINPIVKGSFHRMSWDYHLPTNKLIMAQTENPATTEIKQLAK